MSPPSSSKTITRVTSAIQKYYPLHLADKSWDNTGLLVDASEAENDGPIADTASPKILLTIDLTQAVAAEAVSKQANMVVAYHPFIFRGLKSITSRDPQQKSLLSLIKNNISVYSPHTAVDSAKNGVNDFLADGIRGSFTEKARSVIIPDAKEEGCGMGRLVTLSEKVPLSKLVENVKKSLGLEYVQVAKASASLSSTSSAEQMVSTIAICAGSGGSVFKNVEADVFYTGELSHHEALYFVETGSSVIACNHSNTERAFLQVLKAQLQDELPEADVEVSETDRDPFETV